MDRGRRPRQETGRGPWGQYEATQCFEKAWATANVAYMKALKVSRVAFGANAGAVAALKLTGRGS